jgi:hypothetical protein
MDEAQEDNRGSAGNREPSQAEERPDGDSVKPEDAQVLPETEDQGRKELGEIEREYPQTVRDGKVTLPDKAEKLVAEGMEPLAAMRLCELEQLRSDYGVLKQKYDAELENRRNFAASAGSVSGGSAAEKDYYTSEEWDALTEKAREKFIRNGKVFDFMKKWSAR